MPTSKGPHESHKQNQLTSLLIPGAEPEQIAGRPERRLESLCHLPPKEAARPGPQLRQSGPPTINKNKMERFGVLSMQ